MQDVATGKPQKQEEQIRVCLKKKIKKASILLKQHPMDR